jgi:NitT/TauT family transport system substrate-binding protein
VAASGVQAGQADFKSIMVWNPFVLETLRKRTDAKVLFDSSSIPEEIIDMVVVAKDSLGKPGGKRFAYCIADTFYRVNKLMADPDKGDQTLVALGAKFSGLNLEDMKQVVQQTRFYATPEAALTLFEGDKFRKETMPKVADFCLSNGISDKKPTFAFAAGDAQLTFDSEFLSGLRDGIQVSAVK